MKYFLQVLAQVFLFIALVSKSKLDEYEKAHRSRSGGLKLTYWLVTIVAAVFGLASPIWDYVNDRADARVKRGLEFADAGRIAFNSALKEENLNGIEMSLGALQSGYDGIRGEATVPRYRLVAVISDIALAHERLAYGKSPSGCKYSLDQHRTITSCRREEGSRMYSSPAAFRDSVRCTDIEPRSQNRWAEASKYYQQLIDVLFAQKLTDQDAGGAESAAARAEFAAAARNAAYFLLCQQLRFGKDQSATATKLLSLVQELTKGSMPSRYEDAGSKLLVAGALATAPPRAITCDAKCPEDIRGMRYSEWSGASLALFSSRGAVFADNFQAIPSCSKERTVQLESPIIAIPGRFRQAVGSWYAETPPGTAIEVLISVQGPVAWTKYYSLGQWTEDSTERRSVPDQADGDGTVEEDTLKLAEPAQAYRLRVILSGSSKKSPRLLRVGVAVSDPEARISCQSPQSDAPIHLEVPKLSQLDYAEGRDRWCSPASLGMVMQYWSDELHDETLKVDLRKVVDGVRDAATGRTGNWSFNVAYVNNVSRGKLRAFVSRLLGVSQLRGLVRRDIPVIVSAKWETNKLSGSPVPRSDGHLFVVRGFDSNGNVLVNDPAGTISGGADPGPVARSYKVDEFDAAWKESGRTAYVILPAGKSVPSEVQTGCL